MRSAAGSGRLRILADYLLGARIIDNLLVTANGPELLSQGRRNLVVVD